MRITHLLQLKQQHEKIAMLTCYDASFAQLMAASGIDVLLVGDSLGMVLQGHSDTLPVTLEHMLYHVGSVKRGLDSCSPEHTRPLLLADMPFLTDLDPNQCAQNAGQLMRAGAEMVKIEGGEVKCPIIQTLVQHGIPVCGHLGLTPQSVHQLGGYKVQGKTSEAAAALIADAHALVAAGIQLLVLECVPAHLGQTIASQLEIPVIGIGAGVDCDGQVLVMHDALGMTPGKTAKFVQNFMTGHSDIPSAITAFKTAVKDKSFPTTEHSF